MNVQLDLFFREEYYFFETFKGSKCSFLMKLDGVLSNFLFIDQRIVRCLV